MDCSSFKSTVLESYEEVLCLYSGNIPSELTKRLVSYEGIFPEYKHNRKSSSGTWWGKNSSKFNSRERGGVLPPHITTAWRANEIRYLRLMIRDTMFYIFSYLVSYLFIIYYYLLFDDYSHSSIKVYNTMYVVYASTIDNNDNNK